jgi:hypothetical protein
MTHPISRTCPICTAKDFAQDTRRNKECAACGRSYCPDHRPRSAHACATGAPFVPTKAHLITDPVESKDYAELANACRAFKDLPELDVEAASALALRVWQKLTAYVTAAKSETPPAQLAQIAIVTPELWSRFRIKAAQAAEAYAELLSAIRWP